MKRILTAFILFAYIGIVLYAILFSFPYSETIVLPKMILGIAIDKIAHFIAFMIFTVILSMYKRYNPQVKWLQSTLVILLIGLLFAVGTEGLQFLSDTRSFNEYDLFANIYGVVTGLMLSKAVFKS